MAVGKAMKRVDAADKTNGRAKYTDDLMPRGALVAKVLHSNFANGLVTKIDTSKAESLDGVEAVFTCFDVPDIQFPTAGHPWSTDPSHQDVADRKLLNQRVRYYGDDIAVVVAENEVIAQKALDLLEVEYEEYEPLLTIEDAMNAKDHPIHEEKPDNVLASSRYNLGDQTYFEAIEEKDYHIFEGEYTLPIVQHVFMENANSFAYKEGKKIVVVSSTQIPHIARRVIGQALGIPWGNIKVIKPYIGGGFGGKQDVLYEPLNAWLTMMTGKTIKLPLTREESFINTRTRHGMKIKLKAAFNKEGRLMARYAELLSNQGGYASHGHSVVAGSAHIVKQLYQDEVATTVDFKTIYTNLPVAGAMRAYGVPQINFALESLMEDAALEMGWDAVELRRKNMVKEGWVDPLNTIPSLTNELNACIDAGMNYLDYNKKKEQYKNQTGDIRRGVGMAIFTYKTSVYPISLETASARMVLNQDGSAQIQLGATEIGQGADTVFTQMAAETTGIPVDSIHLISTQDTDVTPFDTGAYASRQSYVSGHAVRKVATLFKQNIMDYCMEFTHQEAIDIRDGIIYGWYDKPIMSVAELALEAQYNMKNSRHITAEITHHASSNTISHGTTFVEVEVDMKLGKVSIIDLINVHDSGIILNPMTARGQVHGGVSMSVAYALSEALVFNPKNGKPYNGNLLGYKVPTSLDAMDIETKFIEKYDPSGPYGNKALGEPPAITPAPAIRNAILNATGIKFNELPIIPERMYVKFKEAGLI